MKIDFKSAEQLAADLTTTHASIDEALVNVAQLTTSVVNVVKNSEITPAKSQATIQQLSEGFSRLVDARKDFVGAHRHINKVQRDSDLETVDFGCKDILPEQGSHLSVVNG